MSRPWNMIVSRVGWFCGAYVFALILHVQAVDWGGLEPQEKKVDTLIDAAAKGDLEGVNAALKSGVDVNGKGRSDWTALHAAAERSHVKVLKRLIEAGAKVNAKEYLGVTPLHWASCRGPREAVRALIDAGADVNAYCVQFDTPLGTAAAAGKIEIAEELMKAGADVNGGGSMTPLVLAAKYGQAEMIKLLAKQGAKVNDPNYPPIHWAGKPEAAKALLEVGADPNLRNPEGETALHLTTGAWVPTAESVKVLIHAKADVRARTKTGSTPLHEAIRHGSLEIVRLLVAEKVDLEAKDDKGNTPLSLAEKAGPTFVEALKAAGAKEDGRTPLQRAVEARDLEKVKSLLREGARVNATGPAESTAVHAASRLGHTEILAELIRSGAKVDERNAEGLRPLHYAANAAVAELLIAAGAKVGAAGTEEAWTAPILGSVMEGRADVVRTLIKHKADLNIEGQPSLVAWAAFAGRLEVASVLLEAGLNPNSKDALRQESALHVVACGGIADMKSPPHVTPELRLKIAQLLIEKGADVNAKAQVGYFMDFTPLTGASETGATELARLLIEKGADVNASPSDGMFSGYTALHAASQNGHKEIVKLLLDRKSKVNALTGKSNFKGVKTPLDLSSNPEIRKLLVESGAKKASELTSDK